MTTPWGVAGFPSGEEYKIGKNQPYFRLPRVFVRDSVDLGGDREPLDAAANQLGGDRRTNRLVAWLGKFSVSDVFDVNQYAHDSRADFLNWAAVDAGTFDYAADAWGYTAGGALEWYQGAWTSRAGALDLSNVPNSVHLNAGIPRVSAHRRTRASPSDRQSFGQTHDHGFRQLRTHGAAR